VLQKGAVSLVAVTCVIDQIQIDASAPTLKLCDNATVTVLTSGRNGKRTWQLELNFEGCAG